jgi:hypothetical protein
VQNLDFTQNPSEKFTRVFRMMELRLSCQVQRLKIIIVNVPGFKVGQGWGF